MGEVATKVNARRRRLGVRLRRLRERAGLTIDQAAPKLDFSASKLSRIEQGQQMIDVHWVRSMLDLYDAAEDWALLLDLARRSNDRGWWAAYGIENKGYLGEEVDACLVRNFELAYVPGLLQTEDYVRAIFDGALLQRTSAQTDKQIKARLIRQRRLTAEQEPLVLHAIIDEAVLRRPVGNRELMRAQQKHVVEIAELPNVTVQVLPTSGGGHVGMVGAFTILSFPEKGDPDVAFVDHVAGALHLERESDVRACTLTFDRLRSDALSPSDSIVFIRQVAESREPDERGDPSARGGPVPRSVAQE